MSFIYLLQFILGITLVYVISTGTPPVQLCERILNFVLAVPGSVAATGAIVYHGKIGMFSSLLISSLLVCMILLYIVRGMSKGTVRQLHLLNPPE